MKSSKFKCLFIKASSFLIVAIFFYTATSKIIDFEQFRIQLGQSPLLSAFADQISLIVIILEIILGFSLFHHYTRRIGLLLSFGLVTMFTTYIFIILNYSDYIPCSCGGIIESLSWNQHLIFNLGLIVICGTSFILSKEIKNLHQYDKV